MKPNLKIDEFVRSLQINKRTPHGLFIGAGASITSGVSSAGSCIWDWKRQIFLTQNPGLEDFYAEITLGSVRKRLQQWLDAQRCWPREGADEEYSTYVKACYPLNSDRARYFQELCRRAKPFVGCQFFSLLAQSGLFKIVWTTNFDGLAIKAVSDSTLNVIECGLDNPDRTVRPPHDNELLHVAIHGDYRYSNLKNTRPELQKQDATLRADLIQRLHDTHLVVCGYSGRDKSVMEALLEAYKKPGPSRLYWCGLTDHAPSKEVSELLAVAEKSGREAFYVESDGFDDVMRRLALNCLENEAATSAREINETQTQKLDVPPFSLHVGEVLEVLRSNAFSLECPSSIWQFTSKELPDTRQWNYLKRQWNYLNKMAEGHPVLAAPFRNEVFAVGNVATVGQVFAQHIADEVKSGIVTAKDLAFPTNVISRLFTSAILLSLAETHDLGTDGYKLLWEKTSYENRSVLGWKCHVHRAVLLSVRRHADQRAVYSAQTYYCRTSVQQ